MVSAYMKGVNPAKHRSAAVGLTPFIQADKIIIKQERISMLLLQRKKNGAYKAPIEKASII
jgi:hypothetical protein